MDADGRGPWWTALAADPAVTPRLKRVSLRGLLGAVAVTAVVGTGVGLAVAGPGLSETRPFAHGTATRPSIAGLVAGCGPAFTVTAPQTPDAVVVDPPVLPDGSRDLPHVTIVPTRGLMAAWRPPVRVWDRTDAFAPHPDGVTRALWDGDMVAYYDQRAGTDVIEALRLLHEVNPRWRMLVAPWPANRERFPSDALVAYAVWGTVQYCRQVYPAQVRAFRESHPPQDAPGYDGATPQRVRATTSGLVPVN